MTPAEPGPSASEKLTSSDMPANIGAFASPLFLQILDTVPFGLFVLSSDGGSGYANARASEILGRGIANGIAVATLAETYSAYVSGTDQPYPSDRMPVVRALAGERATVNDMEIRHSDGRVTCLEVSGAPLFDGDGRVKYAVVVFHDVTATRNLELTLRRLATGLEERAREREGQVEELKRAAKEADGFDERHHDDDALIEPCGRCIVFHEAEQLRENAKLANRALALFLSNFSHEVRTPLNHIMGFSDLIESKVQNGIIQGVDKHAETIRRSGASLLETLDRIITVAQATSGDRARTLEIFDADALVRDVAASFTASANRNRNRFDVRIDGHLGTVRSDSSHVRTAISQIVENACKHCSDGIVIVSASRREQATGVSIEIEVSDTGPGIDPGRGARLTRGEVTPGEPLRDGGLGLGIPLAVHALRAIGGSLGFTTVAGGGTRFVIAFPAWSEA